MIFAGGEGSSECPTFGDDGRPAELAVFDNKFRSYRLPYDSVHPLVGLAWRGGRLFGGEIFPYDDPWTTDNANLVVFDERTEMRRALLTKFESRPNGLVASTPRLFASAACRAMKSRGSITMWLVSSRCGLDPYSADRSCLPTLRGTMAC